MVAGTGIAGYRAGLVTRVLLKIGAFLVVVSSLGLGRFARAGKPEGLFRVNKKGSVFYLQGGEELALPNLKFLSTPNGRMVIYPNPPEKGRAVRVDSAGFDEKGDLYVSRRRADVRPVRKRILSLLRQEILHRRPGPGLGPRKTGKVVWGALPGGIVTTGEEKQLALEDHLRVAAELERFLVELGLAITEPMVITQKRRVLPGGRLKYAHLVHGIEGQVIRFESVQHHSGKVLELQWYEDEADDSPQKTFKLDKAPKLPTSGMPAPLVVRYLLDRYGKVPWFAHSEILLDTRLPLAGAIFVQSGGETGGALAHELLRSVVLNIEIGQAKDVAEAYLVTFPGQLNNKGEIEYQHSLEFPDGRSHSFETDYEGASGRLRAIKVDKSERIGITQTQGENEEMAEQYLRFLGKQMAVGVGGGVRIVLGKQGPTRTVSAFRDDITLGEQYVVEWMQRQVARLAARENASGGFVVASAPKEAQLSDGVRPAGGKGYTHVVHFADGTERHWESDHGAEPGGWRLGEVSGSGIAGGAPKSYELAPEEIADPLTVAAFSGEPWFHSFQRQDASTPDVSGQIFFRTKEEAAQVDVAHHRAIDGLPRSKQPRLLVTRPLSEVGAGEAHYQHTLIEAGQRKTWATTGGAMFAP